MTSLALASCTPDSSPPPVKANPVLEATCKEAFDSPRVIQVSERVFVATGYDLANTILIRTDDGNVIVDTGLSPRAASAMRKDLLAKAPGPTRAVIFTHSHIDHVGGASVWVEPGTEIYATEAFRSHFLKQYGLFQPIEALRGAFQFGSRLTREELPCTGLGPVPDLEAAGRSGARLPTRIFSGETELTIGGVRIQLVEAHGETHDQLFVWLPEERALLPGDNIYRAFPNLYTIRGTSPRPIREWIRSLDRMRRLGAQHLVPSHTLPVSGAEAVTDALTAYRDAIQWVFDTTVRGANAGKDVDTIVREARLPAHLASHPFLTETYGQVDWSIRGLYDYNLGWFDGRVEALYPADRIEIARREIEMMGGVVKVREEMRCALVSGDFRFVIHLGTKLRDAGEDPGNLLDEALTKLAGSLANSNGRAFLLEHTSWVAQRGDPKVTLDPQEELLHQIPLELFFERMVVQLNPERAVDVHETVRFSFTDTGESFYVTIRRGVSEIARNSPFPGSPEPVATLVTDSRTQLAIKRRAFAAAVSQGDIKVEGSWMAFVQFMTRFDLK